ncbi:hypothetical protein, partial [Dolichospermum sp. UHCC 0406]|uniref:hypothetical protein n=1 Tax=Dolichospermum sp. UHCC 0406 TaxID=2590017 RepID=UPI001C2BD8E2
MLLDDFWWGVDDLILSDSEAWRKPYQDIQDLRIFRMLLDDFWWELVILFCQNQDIQDLRID